MPKALVFIKTNLNSSKEVLRKLRNCIEIKDAFKVIGEYDIVANIEAPTYEELLKLDKCIKNQTGIRNVLSLLLIDSQEHLFNKKKPLALA